MSEQNVPWRWVGLGSALFVVSLAVSFGLFHFLADLSCDADDCYGENAAVPLVISLATLAALYLWATIFLRIRIPKEDRSTGLRTLGLISEIAALPVGCLAYLAVAQRFCPGACHGDYVTMAMAAFGAAVVVVAIMFSVGVRLVVLARPADRSREWMRV